MEDEMTSKVMELMCSGYLPVALKAVLELNVLEILQEAGPESKLSASQIVARLPTKNPNAAVMLDRILRLLASHSVLTTTIGDKGERFYGLTPMCKYLLPDQGGVSLAPLFLFFHDKVLMGTWPYLKDSVLEGSVPFDKAYGMNPFDYCATDTRFSNLFNTAMYNLSTSAMRDFLENYKGFEGLKEIVDVGGGTGAILKLIVSKYPQIRGINFDLPHVIADAPSYPGVKHVSGSMFESVPSGDAIFMKSILHAWDNERCMILLRNCWNALPEHGKVILVEFILPTDIIMNDPISRFAFSADLMMLAHSEGGKERTLGEFESLAKEAGFPTVKAFPFSHGLSALEFYKNP